MRPLPLLALAPLLGFVAGALLLDPDPAPCRPGGARGARAASAPAPARLVPQDAPGRGPRAATPATAPAAAPPLALEALLEALDEGDGRALAPGELAALEAAWLDAGLDLPLRAGALRAALERGGRAAFERALDAFDRPDLGPLREVLADAAAAGAAPGDGERLGAWLLDGTGGDEAARALALVAVVRAARRGYDPVALGAELEARVARELDALARHAAEPGARADAAEALARLGTPAALAALDALTRQAPDEEGRSEAALALLRAGADRQEAEPCDPAR